MRNVEEQMREIRRRKVYYQTKKQMRVLAELSTVLTALLFAALLFAPDITGTVSQTTGSVLGATILGPKAGGYIIVALLSFALGIVVTILALKRRTLQNFPK